MYPAPHDQKRPDSGSTHKAGRTPPRLKYPGQEKHCGAVSRNNIRRSGA